MKIGVFGTGMVGQTIAGKLAQMGHDVLVGTRDPAATLARDAASDYAESYKAWQAKNPKVRLARLTEAAAHGELLVNATAGTGSLEALKAAGEKNLAGKILIDIANPLDFSRGMPPSLTVCNTDSLGEQIQRAFPKAQVVKTLNTVAAPVMIAPKMLAGGAHTMFVCGNDAAAKGKVTELLKSFGWEDIVDVGDITSARATEMFLPIWVRLMGKLQTPIFSFKLVR